MPPASVPKVSVLIPTYNYARFLPAAIESVLAQDFGDFELVIGDDASTDGSPEAIRRYAARDPRIRAHLRPVNLGMVANWNACLREARGAYVKFLFGDDLLASRHCLGRLAALLDRSPTAVLAASARLLLDAESRPVGLWNEWRKPGLHRGRDVIGQCLRRDRNLIGEPSAVMFRRDAANRGFDPGLRQVVDLEMWYHLLMQGDFVYDPSALCVFRLHDTQQTVVNQRMHRGAEESLRIVARYLDALTDRRNSPLGPWAQKVVLFRHLHYSRKRAPRRPDILAAEAALRQRLPFPWLAACWARHRLVRPFVNLGRALRRRKRRRTLHAPAADLVTIPADSFVSVEEGH